MKYLIVAAALLTACSPDSFSPSGHGDPQFQKVYQGGGSGGHGGGASGSGMCQYPQHWSNECEQKLGKAIIGTGIAGVTCAARLTKQCVAGATSTGMAWGDYYGTPGSDGIARDPDPQYGPNEGPTGYPACQFACQTQNDPPFNSIPGGGYGYGYW